ncbi:carboxypeptidase regulatory-like domain-containing protein [candidate division WWE3 bacterium]|uniref:Carboxypeptidase regulatory-like domain-containing protein n=1 Tax=candidate division WWE3 bacterium TaxID=2053526 RepID=A0A955RQW2_UNCKA|nr:carboxypeptidase regulatory-like domain-containing protein [candidate division WWE3 bacterium]
MYVIDMGSIVGGIMSVIFIIFGGFQIMTARDDPDRLEKGRNRITWAVLGLILSVSTFVIIRVIANILQVPVFGPIVTNKVYAQETQPVATVQITGRVYDSASGEGLTHGDVYLYWNNDGKWEIWPGKEFNNQGNPQKPDENSEYNFLVTPGDYYVKAKSFGYHSVDSEKFVAQSQPVRVNLYLEQASALWRIIFAIGIVLFAGLMIYMVGKMAITFYKKRRIKQLVLQHAQMRSQQTEQVLYPQQDADANGEAK